MLWAGTDATLNLSLFDEAKAETDRQNAKPANASESERRQNAVADAPKTRGNKWLRYRYEIKTARRDVCGHRQTSS